MNKYNNPRLTNTTIAGSGMKHPVRPHVILGNPENGYIQGDIMDANAVAGAVNTQLNEMFDGAPEALDSIGEIVEKVRNNSETVEKLTDVANSIVGPKYKFLDYLFTDGTTNAELVEGKTPVAICVGEASFFGDGKARFMALKLYDTNYKADGSCYSSSFGEPLFTLSPHASGLENEDAYLQYHDAAVYSGPLLADAVGFWEQSHPINGELLTSMLTLIHIHNIQHYDNAGGYVSLFSPGYKNNEWYLPAMGEFKYLIQSNNWRKVNSKISNISAALLENTKSYATSNMTSESVQNCFTVSFGWRGFNTIPCTTSRYIRMFISLEDNLTKNCGIVDWNEKDETNPSYIKNNPFTPVPDGNEISLETMFPIRVSSTVGAGDASNYTKQSSTSIDVYEFISGTNKKSVCTTLPTRIRFLVDDSVKCEITKDGIKISGKTSDDVLLANGTTASLSSIIPDLSSLEARIAALEQAAQS